MSGVDYFLKVFREQIKESDRMIVCDTNKENSFDVFVFRMGKNKFIGRIETTNKWTEDS